MSDDGDEARDEARPMPNYVSSSAGANGPGPRSPAPRAANGRAALLLGTPRAAPPRTVPHPSTGAPLVVHAMTRDVRDANDVVHRDVGIPPAVQAMLDTPPVQRLANLKQLGCAFHAYPCCTHTRKEHSLGVMELAGRMGRALREKQPALGISGRDVLCLRIAGLCHDLGHGPFSHVYETFLRASRRLEGEEPERYEERNRRIRGECGTEPEPLEEGYEHELTSCTMVDFALATLGLEIDWDNLDEPLKQIGEGIDAKRFGLASGAGEDQEYEPLTSRDFIFIKECIYGKPLPRPHAPADQRFFVGREVTKEFLYDVVNNALNGLDVDKIDYYDRDSLMAFGCLQGGLSVFLREACVCWADCPDAPRYFEKGVEGRAPGERLTICYPSKHASSAMNFFATRIKNHENVYTHKKTKAAELHMVDLLLEADRHFCMLLPTQADDPCGLSVPSQLDNFKFRRLPISRAWTYPRLFLRVDDTITSILESKAIENSSPELGRLRDFLNNQRSHRFYKCVGEVEIGQVGGDELWERSEDAIKEELLEEEPRHRDEKGGAVVPLEREDFIVEKREIHYGRKDKNPVSQMRFLTSKSDQARLSNPILRLPKAEEVKNLPMNAPRSFLRRTIRFFCCNPRKYELVYHSFRSWKDHMEQRLENPNCVFEFDDRCQEVEDDSSQPDTQPVTQDDDCEMLEFPTIKRKASEDGEAKSAVKRIAF